MNITKKMTFTITKEMSNEYFYHPMPNVLPWAFRHKAEFQANVHMHLYCSLKFDLTICTDYRIHECMNKHAKIYLFLTDDELLIVKGCNIHIKWTNVHCHETWLMHLTRIFNEFNLH